MSDIDVAPTRYSISDDGQTVNSNKSVDSMSLADRALIHQEVLAQQNKAPKKSSNDIDTSNPWLSGDPMETPTESQKSKLQETLTDKGELLDQINDLEKNYHRSALTFKGKGEFELANLMSQAGLATDSQKELIAEHQAMIKPLLEIQNKIVRDLVGPRGLNSAYADPEKLKKLAEQAISIEMSPDQFETALKKLKQSVTREYSKAGGQLTTGIAITPEGNNEANIYYHKPDDLDAIAKQKGWIK